MAQQDWEKKLEASIGRVEQALEKNKGSVGRVLEALIVAAGTEALEQVKEHLERTGERRSRREERRRKEEERRRRREAEEEAAAKPQGVVLAAASLLMLAFALINPAQLWWMLFVAFGLGMGSASLLAKAWQRDKRLAAEQRAELAAPGEAASANQATSAVDARLARVDATCEKLLAEIKSGPAIVREVIHRPEQTIASLRAASRELARREAELRLALTDRDEERLRSERDALALRIGAEQDEVVRGRLGMAFRALEEQLAQRAELATAASRYEAEATRILYTLESLRTQILRARSADAASSEVAGAGLRRSLEQLSEEVDAVAEALETVNRMDDRVSPVGQVDAQPAEARSKRERS